jgi:hypothetical protein
MSERWISSCTLNGDQNYASLPAGAVRPRGQGDICRACLEIWATGPLDSGKLDPYLGFQRDTRNLGRIYAHDRYNTRKAALTPEERDALAVKK